MLKYCLTAGILKAFSCCSPARKLYRTLGNTVGQRRRLKAPMPLYYVTRVERNVRVCRQYALLKPGDRLLELGTGWVHWEALCLRLFFNFESVLYDVWDNRQFDALKSYLAQLDRHLEELGAISAGDAREAQAKIQQIGRLRSFDELYSSLGFTYIIDPSGMMEALQADSFEVIISAGVFEHIPRDKSRSYVQRMAKLLKPGGYCILSINIADHLYAYDRAVSPKQYLAFSNRVWMILFENDVQYINRLQRCDWLSIFDEAGLEMLVEEGSYSDLSGLKVSETYNDLSERDRDCTVLDVVLRKK